ncbi:MAG: hypothetical protein M0R05_01015 [Bacilli bacterium]|nr:hypothetical protein [Bacilli bacterium]MDD4076400.1 hypothetical protein [Bacilli bacterium]MDD4388102.1 hypothetical protein [Bacilli bacterium]
MISLKIENLKLNNYLINIDFSNQQAVAIWASDIKIVGEFFSIIAGINKNNNTCFYYEKDVFDNKEYFQSRVYFDFRKRYLSSLKLNYLEERFRQKYNIVFNKNEFRKVSEILDIRGETEVSNVCSYTKTGNTFVNYALTRSLEKSNIIINNPTINLSIKTDIDIIASGLTDKSKYNMIILGPDNLSAFNDKLDKIIFFSDFNNGTIMADNKDSLIVVKGVPEGSFNNENIIYRNDEKTILLNKLTRSELKNLQKKGQLEIISVYQIDEYVLRSDP